MATQKCAKVLSGKTDTSPGSFQGRGRLSPKEKNNGYRLMMLKRKFDIVGALEFGGEDDTESTPVCMILVDEASKFTVHLLRVGSPGPAAQKALDHPGRGTCQYPSGEWKSGAVQKNSRGSGSGSCWGPGSWGSPWCSSRDASEWDTDAWGTAVGWDTGAQERSSASGAQHGGAWPAGAQNTGGHWGGDGGGGVPEARRPL